MSSYSETELSDALKAWNYQKTLIKSDFIKKHIYQKREMKRKCDQCGYILDDMIEECSRCMNRKLETNNPPVAKKDSYQIQRCDDCGDSLDEDESEKCSYCKNKDAKKTEKRPSPTSSLSSKRHILKRSKQHRQKTLKCSTCKSGLPEGEYGQCFYCKRLAEGY